MHLSMIFRVAIAHQTIDHRQSQKDGLKKLKWDSKDANLKTYYISSQEIKMI